MGSIWFIGWEPLEEALNLAYNKEYFDKLRELRSQRALGPTQRQNANVMTKNVAPGESAPAPALPATPILWAQ
jgi:hypothetical protein